MRLVSSVELRLRAQVLASVAVAIIAVNAGCKSSDEKSGQDAAAVCPPNPSPTDAQDALDVSAPPNGDTLAGLPAAQQITATTLYKAPLVIEGLTADHAGNLYAAGRGGSPCPVWRVPGGGGDAVVVGNIPAPCNPNGLAFNKTGDLFVGETDKVWRLTPSDQAPPTATVFASGVPNANGLAFDKAGTLWVTDGNTGRGRVWTVAPDGTVLEAFRVQPLANEVNLSAGADAGADAAATLGGVGRDNRVLPPGTVSITPTTRTAADTAGSQPLVANGIAFGPDGTIFVADTARGVLWKVTVDGQGHVTSPVGCDTTFTPNTLCLDNAFVAHPYLEGLDGIIVDQAGNVWGVAAERNAIVVVTPRGGVREVFRNPPSATTQLRNGGPLEFPTSPFLVDHKLCITQSDVARRDNVPNGAGEVGPGVAGPVLGKISCLDQAMPHAGLPLPVE